MALPRALHTGPRNTPGDGRPAPASILLLAMLPIGDTLFITPTIRALRQRHPHARITALARAANAPILRCVPELDEVLTLPALVLPSGVAALPALLAALRGRRFAAAVDFTSPAYKWISLAAGVPTRTYMKFDPLWWLVPGDHARWRATHATCLYYDCACELGLPPWAHVDHRPRLVLPNAAHDEARAFLRTHGLAGAADLIVGLHPGGAGLNGHKRWPAQCFAVVADDLATRWGARILLLGGPDEVAVARAVAARMRGGSVRAAGMLSLLGSIALIARCRLFIGNDSSLLHAAAATGTPYVGIFGPTCLANFQPVPAYPRQGRLVAPWPPAARPSYFVGGRPIWQPPGDGDAARALATITPDLVLGQADALLRCGAHDNRGSE